MVIYVTLLVFALAIFVLLAVNQRLENKIKELENLLVRLGLDEKK